MAFLDIFKKKNIEKRNLSLPVSFSNYSFNSNKDATSYAAIDLIASSVANLTGAFYNKSTKQALKEHYLYDLINNPNLDDSKFLFMYSSVRDYFYSGNVYWYKFDINGEIVALYRINPNKVKVVKNSFNQKVFQYNGKEYDSGNILHIPSRFGYDGLIGKSIFSECNDTFRLSSEIDEFINNSFNNSIGNRLVIDITKEYPNASEEQIQQLKNKFQQNYSGVKNAGKPLVKTGKIDYSKIETDYKDNKANQLIENREFQEKEISKLFGIPLPLLKGTETTNIESLYILFIENAIHPIATQFEQSINRLIPIEDRSKIFFEYSYNSLLKTSLDTRINVYAKQLNNGMLTVNEVRRKENLPEITTAGDNLFLQANLMPLTEDVVNAYMAKSKLLIEQNLTSPNTQGDHDAKGDDKI